MSYQTKVFLLHITIPLLIAVFSFFVVADFVSRPSFTEEINASVDESRDEALKLAGSSTAVSVAITALPGDLATPVAETLAKLNEGFLIILCVLYLEKFLAGIAGTIAFQWLIPLACAIYAGSYIAKNDSARRLSFRIAGFALAFFMVIPVGTGIAGLIRERYGATIHQTIASAESSARLMEESVENHNGDKEAGNGLAEILRNLQQTGDSIARGTSQFMKYLEKLLNRFMEAIAVMIVTSCLIPLLVMLGFIRLGKMIFRTGREPSVKNFELSTIQRRLTKEEKDEKKNR